MPEILWIIVSCALGFAVAWLVVKRLGHRSAKAALVPVLSGIAAGLAVWSYRGGVPLVDFVMPFALLGTIASLLVLISSKARK